MRRPARRGTGPAGRRRPRTHGNDVAYGPISRNCSSASSQRPRRDQDVREQVADLGGPRVAGRVARRRAGWPRSAAASIRSSSTDVGAAALGQSSAKAARTGSAWTREPGSGVLGGPLGEVEALAVRAVPGGREVLQRRHMAAVVVRGAAYRLLPQRLEGGVRGVGAAGVVQGDPPGHRVARVALGGGGDQRADLAQQFGAGGRLPGPADRQLGLDQQRVRVVRGGGQPVAEPAVPVAGGVIVTLSTGTYC